MQKIKCEVCGSENIVKSGKVFICLNCGCKYLPDSEYELSYLQEEDIPSIEEILSHKGLNPVTVKRTLEELLESLMSIPEPLIPQNSTEREYLI